MRHSERFIAQFDDQSYVRLVVDKLGVNGTKQTPRRKLEDLFSVGIELKQFQSLGYFKISVVLLHHRLGLWVLSKII